MDDYIDIDTDISYEEMGQYITQRLLKTARGEKITEQEEETMCLYAGVMVSVSLVAGGLTVDQAADMVAQAAEDSNFHFALSATEGLSITIGDEKEGSTDG